MDNELEIMNNEEFTTGMEASGINSQLGAIAIGFASGAAITVGAYFLTKLVMKIARDSKAKKANSDPEKTES